MSQRDISEFFSVSAMTYSKLEKISDIPKQLFNKLKPQLIKLGILNEDQILIISSIIIFYFKI